MPGGSIARITVASGARYRSATSAAKRSESGGSSGPSLRTRAAIGRTSRPSAAAAAPAPTITPIAWRPPLPNGTRTASPVSSGPSAAGAA